MRVRYLTYTLRKKGVVHAKHRSKKGLLADSPFRTDRYLCKHSLHSIKGDIKREKSKSTSKSKSKCIGCM